MAKAVFAVNRTQRLYCSELTNVAIVAPQNCFFSRKRTSMARSRQRVPLYCGSLLFQCDGLPPSTGCRSPGAQAVELLERFANNRVSRNSAAATASAMNGK